MLHNAAPLMASLAYYCGPHFFIYPLCFKFETNVLIVTLYGSIYYGQLRKKYIQKQMNRYKCYFSDCQKESLFQNTNQLLTHSLLIEDKAIFQMIYDRKFVPSFRQKV